MSRLVLQLLEATTWHGELDLCDKELARVENSHLCTVVVVLVLAHSHGREKWSTYCIQVVEECLKSKPLSGNESIRARVRFEWLPGANIHGWARRAVGLLNGAIEAFNNGLQ